MHSLIIAFATYSRIPMPRADWSEENRRYALCFFPMVGLVTGGAVGLWIWLCGALAIPSAIQGAVGAALPLCITGGIHMDGFMDTVDALASWQPRERRLEILKDTHTGAFAVMGCAVYLLIMAAFLGSADARLAPAIGTCYVLSRAGSALTIALLPSARPDGMLAALSQGPQKRTVLLSSVAYIALALAGIALTGIGTAAFIALALICCILYYRHMALSSFGGVTGDLAGWFVQVFEICGIFSCLLGRFIL